MTGIILGIKENSYIDKNTGEVKSSKNMYVMWDKQPIPEQNLTGNTCSEEYISFALPDGVKVGIRADFIYDIRPTNKGVYARLCNIIPVENVRIVVESIKK